ncbi:biotin synthase [Calocera cornea HHB12733]|uniref:biotin synthase n=1 Tax=Calocera cornea HHB12733 TaxID=1353952 RepID=A0A165CEX2_9BASI|nr:biotin synthase [Calocera cornea HHB12733]
MRLPHPPRLTRSHATAVLSASPLPAPPPPPHARPAVRNDWTRAEVQAVYDTPLMELVYRAASVHRVWHDPAKVQLCTLMNIKTGGCSEDCAYCSQSSRYDTATKAQRLVELEPVLAEARKAKANGSTRFCMGAAWRDLAGRKSGFSRILEMVREVRGMGMEVCTTLGMLSADQARQLKEAGLTAYNHNLDTSREFYPSVISTRTYDERLATLANVREAGINVCSGGILGLGEQEEDRVGLIAEVANLPEHPESFPVNALVPIRGTPLEGNTPTTAPEMIRTIATARIVLPRTIIRLAAGRQTFTETEQAMCFMAGANAVFTGEKMLTTPCSGWEEDKAMFDRWGLEGMESFTQEQVLEKERAKQQPLPQESQPIHPEPVVA